MVAIDLANFDVDRAIFSVESRNELRTVIWRFVALAVLSIAVALEPDIASHRIHVILVAAYAATSLIAVSLVITGRFRTWMNWLYALIDASLVVYLAAEHMFIPGATVADALATPSLAVAFVLLAHASMRMRVGPVVFFAVIVAVGSVVTGTISFFAVPFRVGVALADLQAASVRLLAFVAVAAIQIMLVVDIKRLVRSAISSSNERANLARFFSPGTAELLAFKGLGAGLRRHEAVVIFLDIRGFTGQDAADKALQCANQLIQHLETWSDRRVRDGEPPLSFAIGLHAGSVIGGVIPAGSQSEYTVLGDAVNLASRLQSMCRRLDANIVMSQEVLDLLPQDRMGADWVAKINATILGRAEPKNIIYLPSRPNLPRRAEPI